MRLFDGRDRRCNTRTAQARDAVSGCWLGSPVRACQRFAAAPAQCAQLADFLTLVGLTALLVGGVGVANAVMHYLDRKRADIATLKAVGATGGTVFAIYLSEIALLAGVGIAIGLVLGTLLPFAITFFFGR